MTGCAGAPSISQAPEPHYPSCDTVNYIDANPVPDIVWQDVRDMVIVMEQIRATLPEDERPRFGKCELAE